MSEDVWVKFNFLAIELKYFSIIVGLNYMVTTLLAALIIKENISPKRFFGCVLVATGSILFSW